MIEIHHVLIAVLIGLAFGVILGLIFARILVEKDAKAFWNNPRNNDEFLNVNPKTDNRKKYKSWEN